MPYAAQACASLLRVTPLFSNKPHLKQKLHSFGQQALSVTTRLSDIKRAGVRREAELYVRLGELNRQLVDMEAAHLALQHSRDELVRSKTRDPLPIFSAAVPRSATLIKLPGSLNDRSTTNASPIHFSGGRSSIVPPPATKCSGASICVPAWL